MNDLDDRKSFVLTKSKDTFNRYKLHGNVRTNDFCDTTTTTMLHKTHLVLIGRKNKARAKNFIGKLDFVWNVNLLKCVQCLLLLDVGHKMDDASVDSACLFVSFIAFDFSCCCRYIPATSLTA